LVRVLDMPFRRAHHVTGKLVALADSQDCRLDALKLADMQAVEPRLDKAIYEVLSIDSALQARNSFGGTAPAEVEAHIKAARAAFIK
jgi:argininosuccinate lyase